MDDVNALRINPWGFCFPRGKEANMNDQDFMGRAIALARQGAGWTAPNPMVGAVIVKNGRIIGEGSLLYHHQGSSGLSAPL